MACEKEPILKEAKEELDYLVSDDELRRIADLRQKAIWDENSLKAEFEQEKEKIEQEKEKIESALKEAKQEVKEIKEKAKEAIEEKQIEIAKKMKAENFEIEVIAKMTGLSKEEIEKL